MVKTLDGSSPLVLSNVLLIPKLGYVNLMSWKAMRKVNGGLFLHGSSDNIFVQKGSLTEEIVI